MNSNIIRVLIILLFSSQIALAQETNLFVANPIPDIDTNEDDLFNFQLPDSTFGYVDSVGNNFRIQFLPTPDWAWIYLADSITLRGIPTNLDTGIYKMTVWLLDSGSGFAPAIDTFLINVHEVNDNPIAIGSISSQILYEGFLLSEINFQDIFFDEEDSTSLIYSASIVSGTSVSIELLENMILINELGIGETEVNLNVQDSHGGFIDVKITIIVASPPANPIPDIDTNEDELFTFQLSDSTFSYVDSFSIEFIAIPENSTWIYSVDSITLKGIPTHLDTGENQMTVRLLGSGSLLAIDTFMINVHEVNDNPVSIGSISSQILLEGFLTSEINFKDVFFDEEDSTNLTYSASIVSGTSVSVELLENSILVNELGIGKTIINFNVQDQHGGFINVKITIIVNALNELMTVNTGNTGSSGLADNKVSEIFKDNANNIWFGTEYGLSILSESGEWENLVPKDYFGSPTRFWQKNNGQINIVYRNVIQTYDDSGWGHYFPSDSINAMSNILASCADSNNTLWIAGKDQTYENVIIASNNGNGWNQQYSFAETGEVTFIESIGDSLYLGTSTAIYTFDGTNLNALPISLAVGEMGSY